VRGDHAASRTYLDEAATIARENGLRAEEALALTMMAAVAVDAGDTAEAAALALESASLNGEREDAPGLLELAECVAALCLAVGRAAPAVELLSAAVATRAELGSAPTPLKRSELTAIEASARAALDT